MLRSILGRLFVSSLCGLAVAASAPAQAPDRLDHFRVLPRLSTVVETGGIAGVRHRYRVLGEYDFVRHSLGLRGASFQDAELWGALISDEPVPAYVLDVDRVFDLNNLEGHALPVGAPFEVYGFRGEAPDGSRIRLYSAVLGPWMYLRGVTRAPIGGADYFEYSLRAVARSGPSGDFNGDGIVDARDYTVWRDSLRSDVALSEGDGAANQFDVSVWREQYGERAPDTTAMDAMFDEMLAAEDALAALAIPEPGVAALAALGCVLLCRRRR